MATIIANRDNRYVLTETEKYAENLKLVVIAYDDKGTMKDRISVYLNPEEVQTLIEQCESFLDKQAEAVSREPKAPLLRD